MEYRKLIAFGKGGFVVSMPKDWVVENSLKKGSHIMLKKDGSSLVLHARQDALTNTHKEKETTIHVDNKPSMKYSRCLKMPTPIPTPTSLS